MHRLKLKQVGMTNKKGTFDLDEIGLFLTIVIILAIFLGVIGYLSKDHKKQKELYNDGTHEACGGAWVYQEPVGHKYTTTYIFKCNKCGLVKEFDSDVCGDFYIEGTEPAQEETRGNT